MVKNLFSSRNERTVFAGFTSLVDSSSVYLISDLKLQIVRRLEESFKSFRGIKYKYNIPYTLSTLQHLSQHILNQQFDREFCYSFESKKNFHHHLPVSTYNVFKSYGLSVNQVLSSAAWKLHLLKRLIRGFFKYFSILQISFQLRHNKSYAASHSIYLCDLSLQYFSKPSQWNHKYSPAFKLLDQFKLPSNTVFKYSINTSHTSNFLSSHNPCIKPSLPPYIFKFGLIDVAFFTLEFIELLLIALINWLIGDWRLVYLLPEIIEYLSLKCSSTHELSDIYAFQFSSSVYRPLWTYYVEDAGSKVISYFYSTYESPELSPGCRQAFYSFLFTNTNWPHLFVWSDFQFKLIQNFLKYKSQFTISGPMIIYKNPPISFCAPIEHYKRVKIALFDIEALDPLRHLVCNSIGEYLFSTTDINSRFFFDILKVGSRYECQFFYKRKRDIGKNASLTYLKLLDDLKYQKNLTFASPDTCLDSLVQSVDFIISMPFTSTAHLFSSQKNKSIYYDPIQTINTADDAANGYQVISGVHNLMQWFSQSFSS